MPPLVKQITPGALPGHPQGFVRLRIRGENLETTGVQLLITRTGAQGGPEYLRAYNAVDQAPVDAAEALQYRWGADEGRILPFAVALNDGELIFDLGRNVNAMLDQQSNYRFLLHQGAQPVPRECTLAWSRVAPVRPGDLATFVAKPSAAKPGAAGAKPVVIPIAPASDDAKPGGFEWGTADSPRVSEPGEGRHGPQTMGDPPGPEPVGSRRYVPFLLAGLLVLAAAGALAYWLLASKPEKEATPLPEPATRSAESPAAAAPAQETREQRLTRIITRGPAAALEAGRQSQSAHEIDDAEFLYRNACERGSADGCRAAAQLYDPTDLTPNRSTQRSPADARQAVSLYRRAVDAGSAEAGRDLERLRELIERAAQAGDGPARVLLDTWPKKP